METKKVKILSKDYKQIKALHKRAFSPKEQYPVWILRMLALRKGIDYLDYYDDDVFCGISYSASTDNMLFVLYLAVNDELRSKGYDSVILDLLKEKSGGREITLNVEPVDENAENYEQRIKRMGFYARNGFGTEEWNQTYKIRTTVERSINQFKDCFGLTGRKTQNEKTLYADLILAGITQLISVVLADKIHQHQYIRSLKPLIA